MQAVLVIDNQRPWQRPYMAAPVACAAGCSLPPLPPPVASRLDWVRTVLGKTGAWPVPVLDLPCEGEEDEG